MATLLWLQTGACSGVGSLLHLLPASAGQRGEALLERRGEDVERVADEVAGLGLEGAQHLPALIVEQDHDRVDPEPAAEIGRAHV